MIITKLEAARRQIDSAVEMYFNERDEVSIHTLVGAAHILITDLSKAAQLQSVIDRHIKPDMRWKFEGAIRTPQNFLKHATEDPDETFDLNPHNTELMLFIDIEMFKELTRSATDPMRAFHMYAGRGARLRSRRFRRTRSKTSPRWRHRCRSASSLIFAWG
jgi:hypothetical protein